MVKLGKGTGLDNPGKIQVQQDRVCKEVLCSSGVSLSLFFSLLTTLLQTAWQKSLTTDSVSPPSLLLPAQPRALLLPKPHG